MRIPIGYWSVIPRDGEPYVQGAYDKLGEALDWANDAGLKVMIDLHGGEYPIVLPLVPFKLIACSTRIAERLRQLR